MKRAAKILVGACLLYAVVMFCSARIHWIPSEDTVPRAAASPLPAGGAATGSAPSTAPSTAAATATATGRPTAMPSAASNPGPAPRAAQRPSVAGALHVHTESSHDSEGTMAEVSRAAQATGLDFVLLSDHPSRVTPESDVPGAAYYRDGVLLVDGREINFGRDVGRVLVFGTDTTLTTWDRSVEDFADLLERRGGTALVVHARSPLAKEAWHHETAPGIAGWESFDLSDIARFRLGTPSAPYHLLSLLAGLSLGFADESLLRLHRNGFEYPGAVGFDSLSMRQPLTAVAGANAHPKARFRGHILPGYEPFFRAFANHLVLGGALPSNPASARDSIAGALDDGRVFISFGDTERARGFRMAVESEGQIVAGLGETVIREPGMRLTAGIPEGSEDRLLFRMVRDGHTVEWAWGSAFDRALVRPGTYRVEVYRYTLAVGPLTWNLRPWIFSNPIHVRDRASSILPVEFRH